MPGRARAPAVDKHQVGWAGRTTNKALAPRPAQSGVLRATANPHGIPCAKASALPICGAQTHKTPLRPETWAKIPKWARVRLLPSKCSHTRPQYAHLQPTNAVACIPM